MLEFCEKLYVAHFQISTYFRIALSANPFRRLPSESESWIEVPLTSA